MSFVPSTAPDITESLPAGIGASLTQNYPPDAGWDVTFGQLGFMLRPSVQNAYQRGTEQVRKQQIDTSDSAGEQSLSSWWVRSQDSWDMGAGVRWYEPGSEKETVDRFSDSLGIDPWTPGSLSLLKAMDSGSALRSATNYVSGLQVADVVGHVEAYGSTATWTPFGGSPTTVTLAGTGATQPAAAGGIAWIGHNGGIAKFTPGSAIATPITCTGIARVWWVKARLIVAVGASLYEVPATATGVLGAGAGTLMYTHPQSTWTWSDVTETAGAILASGYAGGDSAIFRFAIENDTTGTPILTGASQVGRTPPGERIFAMAVYLGTSLVLGTSSGVRIGKVSEAGDVQYGPLTVATPSPVQDVTFRDSFAYLSVSAGLPGGVSGAVRVDLSAEIEETGRFAYAWDAHTDSIGTATSIALVGSSVVLACDNHVFIQSATDFVSEGWLDTGRIRFGTVEPKAFRLIRTVVATNGGTAAVRVLTPDGVEHRVVDFTDDFQQDSDVAIQIPGRPVTQYVSFRLYLRPSTADTSPVISALSVKAVPASSRVRLYQYPLACFDQETDGNGQRFATEGGAYVRLSALETLEETSEPILIADNRVGETFVGQIDSVNFTATTPPDRARGNFGGLAVVQVRRL